MKKTYEHPFAEKVEFDYNEQVVVASGCLKKFVNMGDPCTESRTFSWINDHA